MAPPASNQAFVSKGKPYIHSQGQVNPAWTQPRLLSFMAARSRRKAKEAENYPSTYSFQPRPFFTRILLCSQPKHTATTTAAATTNNIQQQQAANNKQPTKKQQPTMRSVKFTFKSTKQCSISQLLVFTHASLISHSTTSHSVSWNPSARLEPLEPLEPWAKVWQCSRFSVLCSGVQSDSHI